MYTDESIDRIREVAIESIVSQYVELKKSGSNFKGLSPFKEEKTPSFIVSPAKNIFKCFASGKGGDAIRFIQEFDGCSFIEAIETIAQKCNVFLEKIHYSEEQQQKQDEKNVLISLNTAVSKEYTKNLRALPDEHWSKKHLQKLGYNEEVIIDFQLGYAGKDNTVAKTVVKNAQLQNAKELGLVKVKNGASFDFFRDRIIFPIINAKGQVISFGGRRNNTATKYAKYINSPESVVYNKSNIFYGIHIALRPIRKANVAVLVEGYTDVISMHLKEVTNTIATCGTALTDDHATYLCRICDHVILFRDGDKAGHKALYRDIDILLAKGLRVSVVVPPEGEDPDSIARGQLDMNVFLNDNLQDAVLWKTSQIYSDCEDNPSEKIKALEKVISLLCKIENTLIRKEYLKDVSKISKHSVRDIGIQIKNYESKEHDKRLAALEKNTSSFIDGLPEGADPEEYLEKGYVTIGNSYWVKTKNGWNPITNFRLTPLFHIKGGADTPRLFEMINIRNKKALVEIPSTMLLNLTQLQSFILNYGVFTFDVSINQVFFKTLMINLIEECVEAKEFSCFGWQKKGFWAFANGIFYKNEFHEVNKYGIVVIEGLQSIKNEYQEDIINYYSPAFNESNRLKDDDKDEYENDRSFVYISSSINFNTWIKQMVLVYGKRKGAIGIGFSVATMFRDLILKRYNFFPMLYLSGEKGSGKSKYGDSLHKLFTYKLPPFDLNSGTLVGFYRRLARLKNVIAFFEEYHDKIDDKMFQSLKGAFDGRGREKGKQSDDNRTQISEVNSSVVLASQYNTSRDDNSLVSRSITQLFIKKEEYTTEEITAYNKLKEWEEEGLSSLILEVIQHRTLMEQNLHVQFAENSRRFREDLRNYDYEERILNNYNAIYTPLVILQSFFDFPFSQEEYYQICLEGIQENSSVLVESEGLSEFWNTLEKLFERGAIKEGIHFKIDNPVEETLTPKKNQKQRWQNKAGCNVLYLRLKSVHQDYVNEVSRRSNVDVIGEGSIRNYLKSKKYYIGPKAAHRFGGKSTNCYLLNYDILKGGNLLNLDPIKTENSLPVSPRNTSQYNLHELIPEE